MNPEIKIEFRSNWTILPSQQVFCFIMESDQPLPPEAWFAFAAKKLNQEFVKYKTKKISETKPEGEGP